MKHLDPPQLFEWRPSYRYLGGSVGAGVMEFGLAAYFDKLDVCEKPRWHTNSLLRMDGVPRTAEDLRGRYCRFSRVGGRSVRLTRRAVVPAITTLTVRLRRFPAARRSCCTGAIPHG